MWGSSSVQSICPGVWAQNWPGKTPNGQLSKLDQVDPKFVVTDTSCDDGNPLENKNANRMVARVKQRSFFSKRRQHQVVGFFF